MANLPAAPETAAGQERRHWADVPHQPDPLQIKSRVFFRRKTDDLRRLNRWWDALCCGHSLDPRSTFCEELGYYVAELVKNALVFGGDAGVEAEFRRTTIAITIVDDGPGIKDPWKDMRVSLGGGHGFANAVSFADKFCLEPGGRRFAKTSRFGVLEASGSSAVRRGTRLTLVKVRQAARQVRAKGKA